MTLASSQVVEAVDDAFLWIGGISLVLTVAITLTLLAFVFRYHRTRHPKAEPVHGNTALEITWIVIPTLIVLFMFWKGYEGFLLMRRVPPGAMVVEVTGHQWFWSFRYPDTGVTTSELYVPTGRPVKLLLNSAPGDVLHSFYLPAFRVKEDCVPGRTNYLWFQADRADSYHVFCAEFCGKDHSRMITKMHALPPAEYEAWMTRQIEDLNRPVDLPQATDPASEAIRARKAPELYATYCVSCHGSGGEGGLVQGARDFRTLTGWKKSPSLADIVRTLTLGLDGTQMRSFANLSPWDRFALAHHVASFYRGSDRPASTPEQWAALMKDFKFDQAQPPPRTFPIEAAMEAIVGEAEKGGGGR